MSTRHGLAGPLDVAARRGRVAAVEAEIPAEARFEVIDAGQYVTPGLVDLSPMPAARNSSWPSVNAAREVMRSTTAALGDAQSNRDPNVLTTSVSTGQSRCGGPGRT